MIMKKQYMKPQMQVVTIKTQRQLLQSSTKEEIKSKKYSEDMTDL